MSCIVDAEAIYYKGGDYIYYLLNSKTKSAIYRSRGNYACQRPSPQERRDIGNRPSDLRWSDPGLYPANQSRAGQSLTDRDLGSYQPSESPVSDHTSPIDARLGPCTPTVAPRLRTIEGGEW